MRVPQGLIYKVTHPTSNIPTRLSEGNPLLLYTLSHLILSVVFYIVICKHEVLHTEQWLLQSKISPIKYFMNATQKRCACKLNFSNPTQQSCKTKIKPHTTLILPHSPHLCRMHEWNRLIPWITFSEVEDILFSYAYVILERKKARNFLHIKI